MLEALFYHKNVYSQLKPAVVITTSWAKTPSPSNVILKIF